MVNKSVILLDYTDNCYTPQVIAVCKENKSKEVKEYGATNTIDYTSQNIRKEVKKLAPSGVDIVFDAVGGDGAIDLVKRSVTQSFIVQ